MDGGYLLAHVLEVIVPGRDLGDSPTCDVILGAHRLQFPVPSTLRSENIALVIGEADDPVVQVQAYDSRHRDAGLVVVPIVTLVPLEVWNVWYAMDDGEEEAERERERERPEEEMPKMHLLLQYVSPAAAASETPQLREMRAQDFLLRALQQLNASLEAKVQEHQSRVGLNLSLGLGLGPRPGLPGNPGTSAASGSDVLAPAPDVGEAVAAQSQGVPAAALAPVAAAWPAAAPQRPTSASGSSLSGGLGAAEASSSLASLGVAGAGLPGGHSISSWGLPQQRSSATSVASLSQDGAGEAAAAVAGSAASLAAAAASFGGSALPLQGPGLQAAAQQQQQHSHSHAHSASGLEELLKARLQPYEQLVAALEEKQRFYGDQEERLRAYEQSLQCQEQKQKALYAQVQEMGTRLQAQLEAEQEAARQAHASKRELEQRLVELQQELSLRRAHEESLQKRLSLMETERPLGVQQRCLLMDTLEEEVQSLRRELSRHKEMRDLSQTQLHEQADELAKAHQEIWQLREERGQDLEKAHALVAEATRKTELAERKLEEQRDIARSKTAENRLQAERLSELSRRLEAKEAEVRSYRELLERERAQCQEVEKRLDETELRNLHKALDEQTQTIVGLREEIAKKSEELRDEQGRRTCVSKELATAKKELAEDRRRAQELKQAATSQATVLDDLQRSTSRCEELQQQLKTAAASAGKAAERWEQELSERSKAEQGLFQERDDQQKELCSLRAQLAEQQRRLEEMTLLQEQAARSVAAAKEVEVPLETLRGDLHKAYEELSNFRSDRLSLQQDLERLVAKLREETVSKKQRSEELEVLLEDRNKEIKLLMYRVQELSSRYNAAKGDNTDAVLAKWINGYKPAVPFFRLSAGVYLFGKRQVVCKISNDKPVFKVGNGFVGFHRFLELYASEELERLLNYEVDERTGGPKFIEAQKMFQTFEESGALEELRERPDQAQAQAPQRSSSRGLGSNLRHTSPVLQDRRRSGAPSGPAAATGL